jgi:hypothetical protein
MPKTHHAPQVGAPDPELRNSPIYDRAEVDELSLDDELESDACYFNDQRFEIGEYVRSGSELLHCAERGVWLKVTEESPSA